MICLVCPSHYI